MRQLHPDLWTTDSPLRFLGLEVGARMTVMRLPGDELMLHSPIAPSTDLVREVGELGTVRYLVAPNKFHHLFVGDWKQSFPEASIYVAPGLETKRADLDIAGVLGDAAEPGWEGTVDQVFMAGFTFANEVVFFHRPSATLVATDLAFNIGPSSPTKTRLFFRMGGAYDRLAPTHLEKLLIRDRAAFRACLDRVLAWPFERVIVAHGEQPKDNGREEFIDGYRWLLDGK